MELELLDAVKNNDLETVKEYLNAMTDSNLYNKSKVLDDKSFDGKENINIIVGFIEVANIALRFKSMNSFDYIVEHIGKVYQEESRINTALIKGISDIGDLYYFDKAFEVGIIKNKDSFFLRRLIEQSILKNNIEILEQILKKIDFDINSFGPDIYGFTPLCVAVDADNIEAVELLLKNNADPKVTNKNGINPIMKARVNGNFKIHSILDNWITKAEKLEKEKKASLLIKKENEINGKNIVAIKKRKIKKIKGF